LNSDRIHFVLDQNHPTMASHHQKIVSVDDEVAFSGGLDITQRRWDTPDHRGHDSRRVDPGGHCYGPFHDVQICVEGQVARALGFIVRERWKRATGETIEPPLRNVAGCWPSSIEVDIGDVMVGISRTVPFGYADSEGIGNSVIEVERLFLDTIKHVKKFLYIENQYFTSPLIAKAIAKRLREPNGPEFVMVLPRDQTGWIEESTMGLLRSEALRTVESADLFGRFRAYYPIVPHLDAGYVKVHSKVMVADDTFVRIGSANMNSRSMGVDTECDLSIHAGDRVDVKTSIARLRRNLLGEHLGVDSAEFEARFLVNGSLVDTVESFRGGERTLVEMRPNVPAWVGNIVPPGEWIDPRAPKGIRRWLRKKFGLGSRDFGHSLFFVFGVALLTTVILSFFDLWRETMNLDWMQDFWRWTRTWDAHKIARAIDNFRQEHWSVPVVLGGFILGSILFVPISAMIFGVAIVFPPVQAMTLSMAGSLLAAMVMYIAGRYWIFSKSRFLSRPIVKAISLQLQKGGVMAVTAVRLAPIAPFSVVGIVAGGLRVRLRDYVLGSILGFVPGIAAFTYLSSQATRANLLGLMWGLAILSLVVSVLPKFVGFLRRAKA
ncbi:MAG TPA: VTT domain-containing protein, partial [Bdellovibrionales bacterium]|nr:VTT domain-containing protein [Bdellovibrionales bacterium]